MKVSVPAGVFCTHPSAIVIVFFPKSTTRWDYLVAVQLGGLFWASETGRRITKIAVAHHEKCCGIPVFSPPTASVCPFSFQQTATMTVTMRGTDCHQFR